MLFVRNILGRGGYATREETEKGEGGSGTAIEGIKGVSIGDISEAILYCLSK